MSEVEFEEIRKALVDEIVGVSNTYVFLTNFAFPVARQRLLFEHYPFFVNCLVDAFRGDVLIAVCRLFYPDDDRRHASLTNFLQRVAAYHAADQDVDPNSLARRKAYECQIPNYLADIRGRWKPLVIHRSAYLAHRDLTKTPPDITYRFVRECFEQAQTVVAGYDEAYRQSGRLFNIPGLERDAARLLEWCRLDDYERHFSEDMARLKKKLGGTP